MHLAIGCSVHDVGRAVVSINVDVKSQSHNLFVIRLPEYGVSCVSLDECLMTDGIFSIVCVYLCTWNEYCKSRVLHRVTPGNLIGLDVLHSQITDKWMITVSDVCQRDSPRVYLFSTYLVACLVANSTHTSLHTLYEASPCTQYWLDNVLFALLAPAVLRGERQIRPCGVCLVCSFCIIEADGL